MLCITHCVCLLLFPLFLHIPEDVHQSFYNPENMIMFVTGKMDVEEVLQVITDNTPTFKPKKITLTYRNEDRNVVQKKEQRDQEILIPNTLLGVKLLSTDFNKEEVIKKELTYSIMLDMILGKSSPNYQNLLNLFLQLFLLTLLFQISHQKTLIHIC